MNTPFTPPTGPFGGQPGPFGFGPGDRRALHEHRRGARREFREHVREHGGPGFGPGFGREFPGFGPGFGFGPGGFGGRGGRRGASRGGRGKRGDVRAALLTLLSERPMHGYEMIQEIAARSNGLWKPSPGSVYPTLQLLEDEGLITAADTDGSKKLFELTADGRAAAEKVETAPWDEINDNADPAALNLRSATGQLFGAVAQSAHAASEEQQQRIIEILNNARREIYQILGED
ncbi:PadR family transcriptional regulator [Mycobacterium sp. djl-10]|nr:PadR family transcriptional regulator [Mycobacterium sp. djl-10]